MYVYISTHTHMYVSISCVYTYMYMHRVYICIFVYMYVYIWASPRGSVVKTPPANAGDMGLIPESGRSPGEENSNPLQDSCQENSMDRGAWGTTVHGVAKESVTT